MQLVLFLFKKLKDKTSFFYFSHVLVGILVSFCTFLITTIIFILSGFKHEVKKNIFTFIGNYQFYKYNGELTDFKDVARKFSKVRGIKKILPYAKKNVLIQCQDCVEGAVLFGTDLIKDENVKKYIYQGQTCCDDGDIVVGHGLFKKLHIDLPAEVIVFCLDDQNKFLKYRVVGVFETGIDDLDDRVSLCELGEIQKVNGWRKNESEGVNIYFDGDYKELREVVSAYGGRLRSMKNKYVYVSDWLKILEKNADLYIFIILCTMFTSVICVLILQIYERRKFIELLLFMGATVRQVEDIFVLRNMRLVGESGLIGMGLGVVLCFLQKECRWVRLDASDYYLSFVPIYFDWVCLLGYFVLVLVSLLICLKLTFLLIKKK